MRAICVFGIVGICALLALSASGEQAVSPPVETRSSAAEKVVSCIVKKTFEFRYPRMEQDRISPVIESVLSRVAKRGAERWLRDRLSGMDDESLVHLYQGCGGTEKSELRRTLWLPERPAEESSLLITFMLRNATTIGDASVDSEGRSSSEKSERNPQVIAFIGRQRMGMKKLQKTIIQLIESGKELHDRASDPADENKDPTTLNSESLRWSDMDGGFMQSSEVSECFDYAESCQGDIADMHKSGEEINPDHQEHCDYYSDYCNQLYYDEWYDYQEDIWAQELYDYQNSYGYSNSYVNDWSYYSSSFW